MTVYQKAGWKQFAACRSAPAPVHAVNVDVFLCVPSHVLHVSNALAPV